MKNLFVLLLIVCSATLMVAQSGDVYSLNYYANRNNAGGVDQTVRLINPGTAGTPLSVDEGTLCADVYVFDAGQEMIECCSCHITANGIAELSLLNDLTQEPLTGFPAPDAGVIKVVSDIGCNEQAPEPFPTILGWSTHIQQPTLGSFVVTEDEFKHAPLTGLVVEASPTDPTESELAFLGQACSFVQYLGSGKGHCHCGNVEQN
jgi:hypothetical protein